MYQMYEIISKKRDGLALSSEEIKYVIENYVSGNIPDYQVSALLMAIYIRGMDSFELSVLTDTMMNSGDLIKLDGVKGLNIDKHSTGGVGDKISLILAPMVASAGVNVPMLSGRGLGHTGGTLDKLESIPGFNVFLKLDEFKRILNDVGMVICGQTDNIVPADKKLYALRDATATVSSIPLIASSIMSKKLALESDGIVMDVKTGNGAFMREEKDAVKLCETMIAIAEKMGRKTVGLITNMNKIIGTSVGNALEVIESIEALKGKGESDMMEITYALGAYMLLVAGKEKDYEKAVNILKDEVDSGRALNKFREFIKAQGGNEKVCDDYNIFPLPRYKDELKAEESGYISEIECFEVGMAAIDIGAGRRKKEDKVDHATGFVFYKNVGDRVEKNENILTIYANDESKIEPVKKRLKDAIKITKVKPEPQKMILYYADKSGVRKM